MLPPQNKDYASFLLP